MPSRTAASHVLNSEHFRPSGWEGCARPTVAIHALTIIFRRKFVASDLDTSNSTLGMEQEGTQRVSYFASGPPGISSQAYFASPGVKSMLI